MTHRLMKATSYILPLWTLALLSEEKDGAAEGKGEKCPVKAMSTEPPTVPTQASVGGPAMWKLSESTRVTCF